MSLLCSVLALSSSLSSSLHVRSRNCTLQNLVTFPCTLPSLLLYQFSPNCFPSIPICSVFPFLCFHDSTNMALRKLFSKSISSSPSLLPSSRTHHPPRFSPHLGSIMCSTNTAPCQFVDTPAQTNLDPKLCFSNQEVRRLLKFVNIEEFKQRLHKSGKDCLPFTDVVELCKQMGTATSNAEAEQLAKSLDEAGVILIFRNKVFIRPEKVAEVLARVISLSEDDPRREELARLQKEKEEIDRIARKQVRKMLWTALGAFSLQSLLFFRLTFWDFSWDVMEPITFFVTSSSIVAGFLFFILTSRDPSYHDLMHTILSSKQRKLMKRRNFNIERFKELQMQCCPAHSYTGQNVI